MRDPFRWSISLGRWGVPTVRLHVFFVVFFLATVYLSWPGSTTDPAGSLLPMALVAVTLLFGSVLLHEWCHWLVARHFGIDPDTLVIGPLGGLSDWGDAAGSRHEFACLIAGPLSNLLVCLAGVLLLSGMSPNLELTSLFNPLEPAWMIQAPAWFEQGVRIAVWINWLLFLLNLLPAYPFDGGRILRAAISYARPEWHRRRVAETVFWMAVGLATVIVAAALIIWKHDTDALFSASFALVLLAVVLLVSAARCRGRWRRDAGW